MSHIKHNIVIAVIITTIITFITGDYNQEHIIIKLIIGFLASALWTWLFPDTKSKFITKESDEINHPVVENIIILHICNIIKHYGKKYDPKMVETCNCGSTLFRIYNEDTDKGTYIQFICVKCNQKATGLEFNWKNSEDLKEMVKKIQETK